jgi:hypothetical protein
MTNVSFPKKIAASLVVTEKTRSLNEQLRPA